MNKYQVLLDAVNDNQAILTAGRIYDDIPTIHDIGHSLKTDNDVRHAGFGLFLAKVNGDDISFDAGGAMKSIKDSDDNHIESWSYLFADNDQLSAMGYDIESVKIALESFNE